MLRAAVRYIIRSALVLALVMVLFAGTIIGGYLAVDKFIIKADGPHDTERLVVIGAGDGHATIRWTLKRAGVIRELYHYDAARILADSEFVPKEGEYAVPARASLAHVMTIIDTGRSYQRRITVIEGMRAAEIMAQIRDNPHFDGDITIAVPEGSVLPETYFFTHGTSRNAFLQRMQEKRAMSLLEAWVNRDDGLPYDNPQEALILASVIELETARSADRREVAGVFVNRLKKGMRLQSDPTVLYGVAGADRQIIRKSDLKRETRWNTYVISGLPATPICNPSQESIEAALHPAKTDNLYFVSDGKGGLRFARTLDVHNKNVRLFRKAQRAAASD
jgi:UPF0755 protein